MNLDWLDKLTFPSYATRDIGLRRINAPEGYKRRDYYQRYVAWMRSADRALERGEIDRASYRVATALSWKRLARTGASK